MLKLQLLVHKKHIKSLLSKSQSFTTLKQLIQMSCNPGWSSGMALMPDVNYGRAFKFIQVEVNTPSPLPTCSQSNHDHS